MENKLILTGIEIGTVLIEILLVLLYTQRLKLPKRPSHKRILCAYALFFVFLAFFSVLPIFPWMRILLSFVSLTCLYHFCYDIDLSNSIYITAIFLLLSLISDILCSFIVTLAGIPDFGVGNNPYDRITYYTSAKLTHLICIQLSVPFLRKKQANVSFIGTLPLLTAQIASLIVCMLLHYSDLHSGSSSLRTIVCVLAILYINIVICFYVEAVSIKNELTHEKESIEREYQFKLKYYESIKQSQEETRSLWHEIQKYLNTMQTLLNSQENEAASNCMMEANRRFHDLTTTVDVGNSVLNGILNIGLQEARQHHIPFHIDAWVSENLGVTPQDLFIILGNAIDNAIEECTQLSPDIEPSIHISIHQKEKFLVIKVDNPCRPVPTAKSGKIHGYGLKNVQRCVSKYNGEIQTKNDHGTFHFFVLLNMK